MSKYLRKSITVIIWQFLYQNTNAGHKPDYLCFGIMRLIVSQSPAIVIPELILTAAQSAAPVSSPVLAATAFFVFLLRDVSASLKTDPEVRDLESPLPADSPLYVLPDNSEAAP